jgi:hypothetical protein
MLQNHYLEPEPPAVYTNVFTLVSGQYLHLAASRARHYLRIGVSGASVEAACYMWAGPGPANGIIGAWPSLNKGTDLLFSNGLRSAFHIGRAVNANSLTLFIVSDYDDSVDAVIDGIAP